MTLPDNNTWATDLAPPAHRAKQCYGTPPHIKEACELYAGQPLFDPCPWRPQEDGLEIEWPSHVFLNPPYGRGELEKWAAKAESEYQAGRSQVILWLINYANSKAVSQIAEMSAGLVHVTWGRLSFIDPITKKPKKGNDRDSIIYIMDRDGLDVRSAQKAFKEIGVTYETKNLNH